MESNIKVAIIEPVGSHGGMDYYDTGLCLGLTASGADVILHSCNMTAISNEFPFKFSDTFRNIYGSDPSWRRGIRFLRGIIKALLSAVRQGRQVVHLHFFQIGGLQLVQVLLARFFMRRIVITVHDVESFFGKLEVSRMSKLAYQLTHSIIVHNQVCKDELIARFSLEPSKIAVIPHGNYLHALSILPTREESRLILGIPADANVLLFFGQIKQVKGLDVLINAMPKVLGEHPNTVLLIAGRPWKLDFSEFEDQIAALGISHQCVTHIRYISDDEVPTFYSSSDIVILPYRRIYQSGVLLMAMSYSKPVLVSDLPGMTEIVKDRENGFLFKSGDENDLSDSLCALLRDEGLCDEVADRGYNYVKRHHDWNNIGLQTFQLYRTLVQKTKEY